jgi:hypothetical protein
VARLNVVVLWSCRNITSGSTAYFGGFDVEQLVALAQGGSREPK